MRELLLWMVLAQAGDIATTGVGISRGCVETAPLYRSMNYPAIAGVKGGSTFAVTFAFGRQRKASKGAKALVIALAAAGTVATVHNLRTLPHCEAR